MTTEAERSSLIHLYELGKVFYTEEVETHALGGINLDIRSGEFVSIAGPSGCGKTTLLRIIAGLETADAGQVLLQGEDLTAVPVHQRNFGMVFQDYALFPHKNVFDNVAFGLRMQQWPAERVRANASKPSLLTRWIEIASCSRSGWIRSLVSVIEKVS